MYHCTTIVGYLGGEPKMMHNPDGSQVARFSVASNRKYVRSDGLEIKETTWFSIEAWGKMAEAMIQYLHTGSKVLVVGRLMPDPATGCPRVYTKRDGEKAAAFVVHADTVRFLDSLGKATDCPEEENGQGTTPNDEEKEEENSFPF